MIDHSLVTHARRLLDRARVIAEAPAAQLGQGGRTHPQSRPPPRRERATFDQLRIWFEAALRQGTDEALGGAINRAEHELDLLLHGPPRHGETPTQLRFRIVTDYEGRHYADVAELEHVHKTYIWKLRVAEGRDGVWGRAKAGVCEH